MCVPHGSKFSSRNEYWVDLIYRTFRLISDHLTLRAAQTVRRLAVLKLRRLVSGFSPRTLEFNPCSILDDFCSGPLDSGSGLAVSVSVPAISVVQYYRLCSLLAYFRFSRFLAEFHL